MPYVDYVIKENVISAEDVVLDFQELLDFVKEFFEENKYDKNEKTYLALPAEKTQIKFEFTKKPDDYHKFEVDLKFDFKAKQEARGKSRIAKGNIKIAYGAKLIRDYDDKWKGATNNVLRALYDRFFHERTEKLVLKELKGDLNRLDNSIRQYLGI